ncbi:MAG: hypothetical protein NC410_06535 [Oscillibacter sp.]|nr:hypothetical protein [Oscillibacter sp.]
MRKKLTVILPLYFASFILLAFSVFPHHHHDAFICFNEIHNFSTEQPHHHPHPEIPEKGCHIQYLFQADNVKNLSRHLAQSEDTPLPFAISCGMPADNLALSCPEFSLNFILNTDGDTIHQLLFSSHKFTRGPPRLS